MNKEMEKLLAKTLARKSAPPPTKLPTVLTETTAFKKLPLIRLGPRSQDLPQEKPQDLPVPYKIHGLNDSTAITLNDKQQAIVSIALEKKSFITLGAAGTGKTTCMAAVMQRLIQANIPLYEDEHKYLTSGLPSIICCAYTNRAVNNLRKAVPEDLKKNCITIHKLLEYKPEFFEVYDEENNKYKKTMRFVPSRDVENPLYSIHTIIIDEASMVSVELYDILYQALQFTKVQIIFVGDIQQLPPSFGTAILGYKMLELPTIELTEVYRQALDSPIIRLAHRVLSGIPILWPELQNKYCDSDLQIKKFPKGLKPERACIESAKLMCAAYSEGKYIPQKHTILIPFNVNFGTLEFNLYIANYIAKAERAVTHQIIAGFTKKYFSIGDYVLHNKFEATIIDIEENTLYFGMDYLQPSTTLDYWGHDPENTQHLKSTNDAIDIDSILDKFASEADTEKTMQVSHHITVQFEDGTTEKLTSLGDIQGMLFAYSLTVHKSQGSEWERVFCFFHYSHNVMMQRELLYTAITRAKKQLTIICENETFIKGVINQKIKGNTLEEKAEYFKGKIIEKKKSTP